MNEICAFTFSHLIWAVFICLHDSILLHLDSISSSISLSGGWGGALDQDRSFNWLVLKIHKGSDGSDPSELTVGPSFPGNLKTSLSFSCFLNFACHAFQGVFVDHLGVLLISGPSDTLLLPSALLCTNVNTSHVLIVTRDMSLAVCIRVCRETSPSLVEGVSEFLVLLPRHSVFKGNCGDSKKISCYHLPRTQTFFWRYIYQVSPKSK